MNRKPARDAAPPLTPGAVAGRYVMLFRTSWRWLLWTTVAFVAAVIAGVVGASREPAAHGEILRQVGTGVQPALEALRQGNSLRAILLIFWNNLSIMLLVLGGGALVWPLLLSIGPIQSTIELVGANAYILGAVIALSNDQPARLVVALGPHGLFEIPALIIATAWSLKIGLAWLLPGATGRRGDTWRGTLMEAVWIVPLLTVLLAVAAVVEVLVSVPLGGRG